MTKTENRQLQLAINTHCESRHLPPVTVDGQIGPQTRHTGRRVAWLMGVKLGAGRVNIPQRAVAVILGAKRTPAELARATHRKRLRPLRLRAWDQMEYLIGLKVTEQGGNNTGPWVDKIIRANGGTIGEAWCGDTVAACYLWAGAKTVVRWWASVDWLYRNMARVTHPKRGHIVTYSFGHTGLFDEWVNSSEFLAGEGNTGNVGAVSDSQTGGDGVKLKQRSVSLVSGFRRVLG